MPYNPEKGPNDPSRNPETRPGQKPLPDRETIRKIGETAVKGATKDKDKK